MRRGFPIGRGMRFILTLILMLTTQVLAPASSADVPPSATSNGAQILEEFGRQQSQPLPRSSNIAEHERQVIMFSIGALLLLLLLGTASIGVAVAVFGKPLFLMHMIFAGLTVTVAIVHVIVGVVWFFPF